MKKKKGPVTLECDVAGAVGRLTKVNVIFAAVEAFKESGVPETVVSKIVKLVYSGKTFSDFLSEAVGALKPDVSKN